MTSFNERTGTYYVHVHGYEPRANAPATPAEVQLKKSLNYPGTLQLIPYGSATGSRLLGSVVLTKDQAVALRDALDHWIGLQGEEAETGD